MIRRAGACCDVRWIECCYTWVVLGDLIETGSVQCVVGRPAGAPRVCYNCDSSGDLWKWIRMHNNNNIPLIQSSHNARQHRLYLRLSRTTAVHKLGLGCHAGQPMVLDQRWAAAGSGLGQPT